MRILIPLILLASLMSFRADLAAQNFDHAVFDELLQQQVKNDRVDYQALKANQVRLTEYLKKLEQVNPDQFNQWSNNEQMAFWINTYNAITIEGILRNYPIQWGGLIARARFPQNSIRQISGFWDKVFVKVMGKNVTLNDIEHNILRKEFGDPRIHFVIVCASVGCPILESQAFGASDLEQRLEQATRNFINDPTKVRLDQQENVLHLSPIFDWYKEDFSSSANGMKQFGSYKKAETRVIEFVMKYIPEADRNFIVKHQPKLKYLDYDWSLNEQKK
ncbi:DUF547 domain-containing protein [candidate division KSB1 bacterium]|nr:DUF547 domain-containing protein [candidate division KSB1 bacterium]